MNADAWFGAAQNHLQTGNFCAARQDWRGAYTAYGAATEFLLKAIYLKNTQQKVLPADMRTAKSHDFTFLCAKAGIKTEVENLQGARRKYWLTVRDWDQQKRYPNGPFPAYEGKDLKLALLNPSNGIWSWLSHLYQSN